MMPSKIRSKARSLPAVLGGLMLSVFATPGLRAQDSVDATIKDVHKRLDAMERQASQASAPATPAENPPREKKKKKKKEKPVDLPAASPNQAAVAQPVSDGKAVGNPEPKAAPVEAKSLVHTDLTLKYQFAEVRRPGVSPENFHLSNVDVKSNFDLGMLSGRAEGWRLMTYILGNFGGDPSSVAGDVQVASNIQASTDFVKLYEFYLERSIGGSGSSVLFGLRDLNAEFYANDAAGLFLNSSYGVGATLAQTGANGPSIFPATSLAIVARAVDSSGAYLRSGIFDAVSGKPGAVNETVFRYKESDGYLAITEAGYAASEVKPWMASKIALGVWGYSNPVAAYVVQDSGDGSGTGPAAVSRGTYGIAEFALPADTKVFIRQGLANPVANRVAVNTAWGITKSGILKKDGSDTLGIGATTVKFGDPWVKAQDPALVESLTPSREESALEVSWRFALPAGFAVQPDMQLITHPSADVAKDPVQVISLRLEYSL